LAIRILGQGGVGIAVDGGGACALEPAGVDLLSWRGSPAEKKLSNV
jgi:hypothetical protein